MPLISLHERVAELCQDVYNDDFLAINRHIDRKHTDTQCIFIVEDSKLIICFRGSDSTMDWIMNFHVTQTEYPTNSGCYVHSGFLIQWLSIKEEFENIVNEIIFKNDIHGVIFCGHSAGTISSLAGYSSIENLKEKNIPMTLITMGSPKFCNESTKKVMEENIDCTRIVLDRDVITRMPIFGEYCHVGKPIQIRDDCILERETTMMEHLHWLIINIPFEFGITDHIVYNYYNSIRKWLSGEKESDIVQEVEKVQEDVEKESDIVQEDVEKESDIVQEVEKVQDVKS